MAPLKGELSAKRSEGFSPKGLTSCVKGIPISRLDKSRGSVIMKTKGDTVTCSQAPDLIANMLYQLTIRLPSSGQYAFVERTSNKKTTPLRICFRYIGGVAFFVVEDAYGVRSHSRTRRSRRGP